MALFHKKEVLTLKLTYPKFPAYKTCGQYSISKNETRKIARGFDWDKPRYDPQLDLVLAREDLTETEAELQEKREKQILKKTVLDQGWQHLEKRQLELRDNFNSLSDFVRTNHNKSERAKHKIADERRLINERTAEIDSLKLSVQKLEESKAYMDQKINQYRIYERFLEKVVDASRNEFKSVVDLVNRYESLITAKNGLGERQERTLSELETARSRMAKLVEDNTFLLIGLNNSVSNLNSRYQNAKSRSLHWENIVHSIRKHVLDKFREICEVKQSAWNSYLLMSRRKRMAPQFDESDFENHLIFIKKTLEELNNITITMSSHSKRRISSLRIEGTKGST